MGWPPVIDEEFIIKKRSRMSSYRGDGWLSSISTGSISVFTSIVVRHRTAAVDILSQYYHHS